MKQPRSNSRQKYWRSGQRSDSTLDIRIECIEIQIDKIIVKMQQLNARFAEAVQAAASQPNSVGATMKGFFEAHLSKLQVTRNRKEEIMRKNESVSSANLRYRSQLAHKIKLSIEKHEKKRKAELEKRVKQERFKLQEAAYKTAEFNNQVKISNKERLNQFMQSRSSMEEYWVKREETNRRSFHSQLSVPAAYRDAVIKKRQLQNAQSEKSIRIKNRHFKIHQGRREKVNQIYSKKKQSIHQPHNKKIEQIIQKHTEIMEEKKSNNIQSISQRFSKSEKVINQKKKALEKKYKDKEIDDEELFNKTKLNQMERYKYKMNDLIQCKCHQANLTTSVYLAGTKNDMFRKTDPVSFRRSMFMEKSSVVLQHVNDRKEFIRKMQEQNHNKILHKEKQITEALRLRLEIENQSNCAVRKINLI